MYLQPFDNNYTLVGDASNGQEAIQILNEKEVHIILSDVRMPIMDGVSLSEYVNKNCPHIALVMLSNYDDFNYVKTTLKNGAVDYLLKHTLNSDVLGSCLKKITDHFDEKDLAPPAKIKRNLFQMQNQFILRLIEPQDTDREHLIEEMTLLALPLAASNLIVCTLHIDDYAHFTQIVSLARKKAVETSILNLITQAIEKDYTGHITHIGNEQYVLILSFEHMHSAAKINGRIAALLQQIRTLLSKFLSLSVSISYSPICRDITNVSAAYDFVCKTMQQKFIMGKNRIYDNLAIESGDGDLIWLDSDVKKSLISELNYGKQDTLQEILKQVFDELKQKQVLYSQCHLLLYDLLGINQTCSANHIQPSVFYGDFDLASLNLGLFETLNDIEDFITSIYLKLYDKINKGIDSDYSSIIKNTITYVKNNYSQPFSLSEVASALDVHKSYLSNLFKNEVGIGFSKYLTLTRIEHAKELMRSVNHHTDGPDLKAIALECGFNSYSYFSSTFKKMEAISPAQFVRENH